MKIKNRISQLKQSILRIIFCVQSNQPPINYTTVVLTFRQRQESHEIKQLAYNKDFSILPRRDYSTSIYKRDDPVS